jgi:ribonuclease III
MTHKGLNELSGNLGYHFKNLSFLEEALHHSSFVNEQNDPDIGNNERLEFLGDAVLNLAVGHLLMLRYQDITEGDLSRMRAGLVNESRLAEISRAINLGPHIRLGKGELQSNGFNKQSILADAFEAVVAAIYLDGGYDEAFAMIRRLFQNILDTLDKSGVKLDYKSRLQEQAQLHQTAMPLYTVVEENGPDHDKTFTVKLIMGELEALGSGKSKKAAEQDAARNAYADLEQHVRK